MSILYWLEVWLTRGKHYIMLRPAKYVKNTFLALISLELNTYFGLLDDCMLSMFSVLWCLVLPIQIPF